MLYINKQNQIYSGDCLDNDRQLSQEEEVLYLRGYGYEIQDGQIVDISQTPEYIAEQKLKKFQSDIQYQHDAFNEYSREAIYRINYNTALGNTTLVTNLQSQLQAEQQAVIARINAITEAYNANI